ncbi:MAG: hypothetical protein IPK13_14675 [Deltaproteobacteria bacterium]|nr:hypothetical protein [Deltaproteobacteria bacterium]
MDHDDAFARQRFADALSDDRVKQVARRIRASSGSPSLIELLELARSLSQACGATGPATILEAELMGYEEVEVDVPPDRRAVGFASAFPVRALDLGLLDPEEIFLANREKFSQVTLTIGQPIDELQAALSQIRQGGVLALKVPAAEVTSEAAGTDEDTEVYIYILPREIQRIVEGARARALEALIRRIVEAAVPGEQMPTACAQKTAANGAPTPAVAPAIGVDEGEVADASVSDPAPSTSSSS